MTRSRSSAVLFDWATALSTCVAAMPWDGINAGSRAAPSVVPLRRSRAALTIKCACSSSNAERLRTTAAMAARLVRVSSSLAASARSRRVVGRNRLARKNSRPIIVQPWTTWHPLATWQGPHVSQAFTLTGEDAAAIRAAFDQEGELSAAIELRRCFRRRRRRSFFRLDHDRLSCASRYSEAVALGRQRCRK